MKIKVCFRHEAKSKIAYASPSVYFMGDDCSTGPIVERGKFWVGEWDARHGDRIEFRTTRFENEFEIRHYRGRRMVNMAARTSVTVKFRNPGRRKA